MTFIPQNTAIQDDTEGWDRKMAEKKMTAPLKKVFDRWSDSEQGLRNNELNIRYQWSLDIVKISQNPGDYGPTATDLLFEAMGLSRTQVAVYRNVGTFITRAQIGEIQKFNADDKSKHGRITWSHLVELTKIADTDVQNELIGTAARERWGVETLRSAVQERLKGDEDLAATERRQASSITLAKKLTRSANGLRKAGGSLASEEFMESLRRVRKGDREEAIKELEFARKELSSCLSEAKGYTVAIEDAITELAAKSERKQETKSVVKGDSGKRKTSKKPSASTGTDSKDESPRQKSAKKVATNRTKSTSDDAPNLEKKKKAVKKKVVRKVRKRRPEPANA